MSMAGDEENKCKFIFPLAEEVCQRKRESGSEFCICHLGDESKDAEKFWSEVDKILNDKNAEVFSFIEFFFVPRRGDTVIRFDDIEFSKEVYFVRTAFSKEASFVGAIFSKGAHFVGAIFSKEANFEGAIFSKEANFGMTIFSKEANFEGAIFSKEANFGMTIFSKEAEFWRAIFSKEANFVEATFSKGAHFDGAEFSKEAHFDGVTFSKEASFVEAKFSKEANFGGAKFSKEASFVEATFSKEASFVEATFSKEANFGGAKFSKESDFSKGVFIGDGNFTNVTFSGPVRFRNALFSSAKFEDAIFSEGADFFCADFFEQVSFKRVAFDMPKKVKFHKTDLTHASFLYTDVRGLNFLDPEWHVIKNGSFERRAIHDEEVSSDYPAIESLYRQMKYNYEESRNYPVAGDFYIGEMEARLKNSNARKTEKWLLNFYKYLGLYGESFKLPLVWVMLLLLFSTSGFHLLGSSSVTWLDSFKTALTFAYLRPNLGLIVTVQEIILGLFTSVTCVTLITLAVIGIKRKVRR